MPDNFDWRVQGLKRISFKLLVNKLQKGQLGTLPEEKKGPRLCDMDTTED